MLQNALEGSGGSASAYTEAYRVIMRIAVGDKSFSVKIAVARCLTAFASIGGPGLGVNELDSSASYCVKALEDPILSVRDAFAEALGAILALGLNPEAQGIHPSIRDEVWGFLLGCYDPMSTFDEREQIRHRRRAQYAVLKEDCRQRFPLVGSGRFIIAPIITEDGVPTQDPIVLLEANPDKGVVSAPQDNGTSHPSATEKEVDEKIIQWKLTLHQIGLDVVRTDRTLVSTRSKKICQSFGIFLLSIRGSMQILVTVKRGNFRCTERSVGVEAQLNNLASITQVLDPKLHQHLEHLGGGVYLFAFRMLMVLFRREFSFGDSLYLWEMMWALEYDPDMFTSYEDPQLVSLKGEGSIKGKPKSIRQCGKFERENVKSRGEGAKAPLPISVFLVASVLKDGSSKLLTEARGLMMLLRY